MARHVTIQHSTVVAQMVCGCSVKFSPSFLSCFTFSRKSTKRNGKSWNIFEKLVRFRLQTSFASTVVVPATESRLWIKSCVIGYFCQDMNTDWLNQLSLLIRRFQYILLILSEHYQERVILFLKINSFAPCWESYFYFLLIEAPSSRYSNWPIR